MTQVSYWFEGVRPTTWVDTRMAAITVDPQDNTALFFQTADGKAIEVLLSPEDRERLKNVWRVRGL